MLSMLIAPLLLQGRSWGADWALTQGRLTYTVKHTLKTSHGFSEELKGKIKCAHQSCEVLIAVPVNTFKSGDTNRDLHMIQTTKGAIFPMIVARTTLKESDLESPHSLDLPFKLQFAGKEADVIAKNMKIDSDHENRMVNGSLALSLKSFGIEAPSLLGMSIEDQVEVSFNANWKKQ